MKKMGTDERGIAHVLLIILVVVVVAVICGVGWLVFKRQNSTKTGLSASDKKALIAECNKADKDICKFFVSWKDNKYYTVRSTSVYNGEKTTSVYKMVGTDKYHMYNESGQKYEVIGIGNDTYTKNFVDNTWWKQTIKPSQLDEYKGSNNFDFEEPKEDSSAPQISYKKIGIESCGSLQCFKYQVIDPSATDTTEFIWFDTKDYQLRRSLSQTGNDSHDSTFSYEKISITVPSPVKVLGPNQMIVPGQSEPETLPDYSTSNP